MFRMWADSGHAHRVVRTMPSIDVPIRWHSFAPTTNIESHSRLGEIMMTQIAFTRRTLLHGTAAIGSAGLALGLTGERGAFAATPSKLPARGNIVIRKAYIVTMDKDAGDIKDGDVHVRDGEIVAVGRELNAPGARTIDGRGMIVMPGLVETHWHTWNTLLRGMSGEKPEYGYFRTTSTLGKLFTADDIYQGSRLSTLEAINSGITFIHDWAHNIRGPEYARAGLRALEESGLRGRFSYGPSQGHENQKTMDLADLEKLKNDWSRHSNEGLLALGMAWRGQGGNRPETSVPESVWRAEFETARRLGLPVTVHASGSKGAAGQIDGLAKAGMIDKVQIVHAGYATADEITAMKAAGSVISIAPTSEMRIGFGIVPVVKFLDAGIPVGLSCDTVELVGTADMFGIMKTTQNIANGVAESEFKLSARRVLELATIEGARSMGIDDKVGSLKAGKRADIIMISTRAPNLGVFGDPAVMLVTATQPANVDTVMVDGRILKRGGKITHLNTNRIAKEASAANLAVRKRANWW
jgi:cytosine/adenosine deaminase-related metal-dependent hydrolase